MKHARQSISGKGALELIEEAVHLLRRAPLSVLAVYYVGALPLVLGGLYFFADMSRSAYAAQHLAESALGVACLFVWMKYWQSAFSGRLRALLVGGRDALPSKGNFGRVLVRQCLWQSTGLFVLPLAAVPTLPFPWVFAFYQNLTALGTNEFPGGRVLVQRAHQQAALWPKQNAFMLAFLFAFAVGVWINWLTVAMVLPNLLKTLFGFESSFSRSPWSLLNSTFFAVTFGLTYLSVDPLVKAVYVLRCFYGESLKSGEDLKSELAQFRPAPATAMILVLFAMGLGTAFARPESAADTGAGVISAELDGKAGGGKPGISSPELDRAIQQTLQQTKYTWRLPRDQVVEEDASRGVIGRFFERAQRLMLKWTRSALDWIERWVRKLFAGGGGERGGSGYGWMVWTQLLVYGLVVVTILALLILLAKVLGERNKSAAALASIPIQSAPDLADENTGAEDLPEDTWTKLAHELWARGELRLALRAFFFSSLAHLSARNLISLAKFKSNRDYERELNRRGHGFPDLLTRFRENVGLMDRTWYGAHEVSAEGITQFAANVDRIRGGVQK